MASRGIGSGGEIRLRILAEDLASGKVKGVAGALEQIRNIAVGFAVARGFFAIINGLRNIVSGAIDAAASLQTFTVGVETLIAREAVLAGAFENTEQALVGTTKNSQHMIGVLRELSLASLGAFPVDAIQRTWRLNMAYGATSEQAVELTKAILTTAAALGLDTQMVQRLNYNLAQALVAGDLTAINLRQLRLAGLDLARVFYDELGMSVAQVRDQLKSGAMTMQEVSETFIRYAEENFGTAGERMRNTFRGAIQEIKNLFYWSGVDLLTPSLEVATGSIRRLTEEIKGLADAGFFAYVGQQIGKLVETVTTFSFDFAEGVIRGFRRLPAAIQPPLAQVAASMGEFGSNLSLAMEEAGKEGHDSLSYQLGRTARDAFSWGVNIITSLALGIVEAAVEILVPVMNFITKLLNYWLGPGSPPRVAPDIDVWGAKAFTEWLHGFMGAEWDIFNSVQRRLESVFRTLLDIGAVDELMFGTELIQYTKDLAKALSEFARTGVLASGIYDRLREIGGEFGKELAELLRRQVALAKATEEYNKISAAFERAEEAFKKAEERLGTLTDQYNELVETRAPKILVRQKKAEMDAARARRNAAKQDMDNLEKQRDKAEERVETLKEQVRWQESLIDQLRRMYDWQRRIDEALEKSVGKLKKLKVPKPKKGKKGEEEGMLQFTMPDFKEILETAKPDLDAIRDELLSLIPPEAWENIEKIKTKLGELKEPWEDLSFAIGRVWDEKLSPFFKDPKGMISQWSKDMAAGIQDWSDNAARNIQDWSNRTARNIQTWVNDRIEDFRNLGDAQGIQDWSNRTAQNIQTWVNNRITDFQNFKTSVGTTVGEWKTDIETKFNTVTGNIKKWFDERITGPDGAWQKVVDFWDEHLSGTWQSIVDFWNDPLKPAIMDVVDWFKEKLAGPDGAWQKVVDFWNEHLKDPLNDLKTLLGDKTDSILSVLKDIVEWFEEKLLKAWGEVEKWWLNTGYDLFNGMLGLFDSIWGAIKGAVASLRELIGLQGQAAEGASGGGSSGFGGPEEQHFGGYWMRPGLAYLHSNEAVVPLGNQVGINALSRALRKAMRGRQPYGEGQVLYIQTVNVYTSDAQDFLGQMQGLTIPGGA